MSWTALSSGDWITDKWNVLAELKTALAERRSMLGQSVLSYTYINTDWFTDVINEAVTKLHTGIENLIGTGVSCFLDSTYTPYATLADLLGDADGSSAWDTNTDVENKNVWLQIRACFDVLKKYRRRATTTQLLDDSGLTTRTTYTALYTLEAMWDLTRVEEATGDPGSRWYFNITSPPSWSDGELGEGTAILNYQRYSGEIYQMIARAQARMYAGSLDSDVDMTVGGQAVTIESGLGDEWAVYEVTVPAAELIDNDPYWGIAFTWPTPPDDAPISTAYGHAWLHFNAGADKTFDSYYDATAEFTYG